MFELIDEPLLGVKHVKLDKFCDNRGSFLKIYHTPMLQEYCDGLNLREIFVSESSAGVVRGMHFQTPPYEHFKLVVCGKGKVLDVVLDIRQGAPTYGQAVGIELSEEQSEMLIIPPGFAHGFAALTGGAQMIYMTTAEHSSSHDFGILWNSFNFDWPVDAGTKTDDLSERDLAHPSLSEFQSPFFYEIS